ncbi:MAG: hypothetical protein KF883_03045 [Thermomicrobiales bacterium]|jgi:2-dehydro-3-deoxyglucarate aldolase/4-hydroxy-2-oxoheptanedioate aldolase|nr:hypothetical protein [Thermomicrobiales bacterium]MCC6944542.1 hypothetical protein [Thermomicrobiales bacterium]
MRKNTVKEQLASGGISVGTMIFEFNSTGIGHLAGEAGADFVIYDMEHTGWSIETIRELIATSRASKAISMVRVPATQYHLISRPLDVGALGIMVPMVESVEQARLIAQSAKYAPDGARGAAFTLAHDNYEGGTVPDKMADANRETFVIAQIETAQGVESCEAIAAVDGIDCLWVGHFDLSISMGIPGQFDHPDFIAAITRVAQAAESRGKTAGVMVSDLENGAFWKGLGYRAFAYSGDLWLYMAALQAGVQGMKGL